MEKSKVYVWRAPEGSKARYVAVDPEGRLIFGVNNLGEIRKRYDDWHMLHHVEIIRQLDKVYEPKKR